MERVKVLHDDGDRVQVLVSCTSCGNELLIEADSKQFALWFDDGPMHAHEYMRELDNEEAYLLQEGICGECDEFPRILVED